MQLNYFYYIQGDYDRWICYCYDRKETSLEKKLIDLDQVDVGPINILKSIHGKKIKSVEGLVKLDTDNK